MTQERDGFANAFRDLECEICDLVKMARLAQLQVHEAIGELQCEDGKYIEPPKTEAAGLAIFTVLMLTDMTKALEQLWCRLHDEAAGRKAATA